MKLLEWNIHQQGRHSKELPMDILNYINGEDIIVLLEVNRKSQNYEEFSEKLIKKNYEIYVTDYGNCAFANDTLIAVRTESNIKVKSIDFKKAYAPAYNTEYDDIPENLFIHAEYNNQAFIIAGIRIKEENGKYEKRRKQMEKLLSWIKEIQLPIIVLGDFNNLRAGTPRTEWNINVLTEMIKSVGLVRKTPKEKCSWGVSYYENRGEYDGYIQEDHMLLSSFILEKKEIQLQYCWDYIKEHIQKCTVKEPNKYAQREIYVPLGVPDHAALKIEIAAIK